MPNSEVFFPFKHQHTSNTKYLSGINTRKSKRAPFCFPVRQTEGKPATTGKTNSSKYHGLGPCEPDADQPLQPPPAIFSSPAAAGALPPRGQKREPAAPGSPRCSGTGSAGPGARNQAESTWTGSGQSRLCTQAGQAGVERFKLGWEDDTLRKVSCPVWGNGPTGGPSSSCEAMGASRRVWRPVCCCRAVFSP